MEAGLLWGVPLALYAVAAGALYLYWGLTAVPDPMSEAKRSRSKA